MAVTIVSSPSLIMMGDGSRLNETKHLLSLQILCHAPKSTTPIRDAIIDDVRAV